MGKTFSSDKCLKIEQDDVKDRQFIYTGQCSRGRWMMQVQGLAQASGRDQVTTKCPCSKCPPFYIYQ